LESWNGDKREIALGLQRECKKDGNNKLEEINKTKWQN